MDQLMQTRILLFYSLENDGSKFESPEHQTYDYAYSAEEDCTKLYPTCEHSIYEVDF